MTNDAPFPDFLQDAIVGLILAVQEDERWPLSNQAPGARVALVTAIRRTVAAAVNVARLEARSAAGDAEAHSDSCVGRVHDSLGCSCRPKPAAPRAPCPPEVLNDLRARVIGRMIGASPEVCLDVGRAYLASRGASTFVDSGTGQSVTMPPPPQPAVSIMIPPAFDARCGVARVNTARVAYSCRLPARHDGDHHPNPCGHDGCTGLECLRGGDDASREGT